MPQTPADPNQTLSLQISNLLLDGSIFTLRLTVSIVQHLKRIYHRLYQDTAEENPEEAERDKTYQALSQQIQLETTHPVFFITIVTHYHKKSAAPFFTEGNRHLPFYFADILIRSGNLFRPPTFLLTTSLEATQQRLNFLKILQVAGPKITTMASASFKNLIDQWDETVCIADQIYLTFFIISLDVLFDIDREWLDHNHDKLQLILNHAKQFHHQWQTMWLHDGLRGPRPSHLYARLNQDNQLLRTHQRNTTPTEIDNFYLQYYGYQPNILFIALVLHNLTKAMHALILKLDHVKIQELKTMDSDCYDKNVSQLIRTTIQEAFEASKLYRTIGRNIHIFPQGKINTSKATNSESQENYKTDGFGPSPLRRCPGANTVVIPSMKSVIASVIEKGVFFKKHEAPQTEHEEDLEKIPNTFGHWALQT